ncbi:DNA-processing protein DprA [Phosphitispora fastidiosa]|uniref:DNA-processing protein DprA n=1 Tax=Phosphitispora fastidiosa TaxID=2837202 RepID=UPI001E500EA9|nr:DNA processing protein [Phosphitispora fastidiosa]
MDSKAYYVLLSMVEGLGPRRLAALIEFMGSAEKVWYGSEAALRSIPGIPAKVISSLLDRRRELKPEAETQKLADSGIGVISIEEPEYPLLLKNIFDPPKILYFKGKKSILNKEMFAIVGARKATHYGLTAARAIAGELSHAGLGIVSGMARGIDTAAHRGALDSGGITIAVLGCGVDVVYPRENRNIMEEIIQKGAVISEFPPGTSPVAGNFPQRNRLISGLSCGVLVIEAAEKSGSLITVDFALEQGREVFAVPGQVTNRMNRGCHRLIRQGACLVENAGDILEELGLAVPDQGVLPGRELCGVSGNIYLTDEEKRVYNIISDDPISSETIICSTGIRPSEVMSMLLVMELKGLVRQLPGQRYVRSILV